MGAMKWWMVVSGGAVCMSLAWAAARMATADALHNRAAIGGAEAPLAAVPDARSGRAVALGGEATQRAVGGRSSQAQAGAPRSVEESRASLGQMLASWGLVACIALRRIFD
jgi:hypothetical protein